jgi:hypothetical protein
MNNLIGNFIGFEGRINRQKWWMGVIILIVVGIVLYLILSAIMGTGFVMDASVATDPGAMAAYLQKAASPSGLWSRPASSRGLPDQTTTAPIRSAAEEYKGDG